MTINPRCPASLIWGSSEKIQVPGATMFPFSRRMVSYILFQTWSEIPVPSLSPGAQPVSKSSSLMKKPRYLKTGAG